MTNSFGLRFSNDSPEMDETLIKRLKYLKTQSFQKIAEEMMNNLVIEFTENENPIATLEEAKGVDVAAGMSLNGRKLTYEFKIPLTRSEAHPYAICANPGKPIYVSFRTSELDPDFLAKEMGGGNGGQNPGMHAGMGGRGRGRTMAEELEPFSYVKMLGKIQLAGANRS